MAALLVMLSINHMIACCWYAVGSSLRTAQLPIRPTLPGVGSFLVAIGKSRHQHPNMNGSSEVFSVSDSTFKVSRLFRLHWGETGPSGPQ